MAKQQQRFGTFTADDTGDWIALEHGGGFLLLDNSQGNGFGGGTLRLQIDPPPESGWDPVTIKSYTALPDPNPDGIELKAGARVRVKLESATGPTLRWWIKDGGQR